MKITKLTDAEVKKLETPQPKTKPAFGFNPNTTQERLPNNGVDTDKGTYTYDQRTTPNSDIRKILPLAPKYNGEPIDLEMFNGVAESASRYLLDMSARLSAVKIDASNIFSNNGLSDLDRVIGQLIHLAIYVKSKREIDRAKLTGPESGN